MDHSADEAFPDAGPGRSGSANVPAEAARGRGPGQVAEPPQFSFNDVRDAKARRRQPPGRQQLLSYGSHAALAVCLFGFAWAASSYFAGARSPFDALNSLLPARAASSQETAERTELARNMQKMAADIHALEANIEALRAAQSKTAKSVSALDGLSARLDGAKSETTALIAALADRIGRIQREPDSKLSQMADRLDRIERNLASQAAAAAQKQPQITAATAKPQGDAAEGQRKPRLITTWVVRDVYDGTALVESARGMIEVAPGEILPGAGRVKSIERRGSGWILITSEGVVDSIRNRF